MKQTDRAVLTKMILYCDQIDELIRRFGRSLEAFECDYAYQYATGMCILQIGELVNKLSPDALVETVQIPWRLIRAMRNVYAHDYEHTKPDIVWNTITEDIPALRQQLAAILNAASQTAEDQNDSD